MVDISKVYGTLAKRIVGVLVVLIIIPLAFDAFFLMRRDRLIKHQVAENQLLLMEKAFQLYYDQFIEKSLEFLEEGRLSTYDLTSSEDNDFFKPELEKALSEGKAIFLDLNPKTGIYELFVFLKVGEDLKGLSISESRFLKPLGNLKPFIFSLAMKNALELEGMVKSVPIEGSNFALRVAIPYKAISLLEGGNVYQHLFWFLGSILVIGGLGTILLVRKMAKPMKQLSSVMEAVANQNYSPRYQPQPFGFEINALGIHFNGMLESLLSHMEEAKNERVRRELLSQELRIGHEIQLQLLPKEIPKFHGIQMGSRFLPAKEVGGDFFDFFPLSKEELFFVIADGSDKGISACLYSFIVRSMLRSHALAKENLASIVKLTNNLFCQDTQDSGNFVTAWIGILNAKTESLTYASAGHMPALLIRKGGEIEELTTSGIALGVSELDQVDVGSCCFSEGSQLFLYTDGVTDAQNEKGELFGKSRLIRSIKTLGQLEPERLVDHLMKEIDEFSSGSQPYDDLTMLSLKKA